MIKKVLIIAINENWTGISRLPSGLDRAGFETYALCPKKSYLAKTKYLKDSIQYLTFTYSRSKLIYIWILYAFLFYRPDLVIPGDEDAILALQNVANLVKRLPFLGFISKLIRKSMTASEFDSLLLSKSEFQQKCHQWGLRTPKNIVVKNAEDAVVAAKNFTYPLVIKHDAGYGGSGVSICQNEMEMVEHFKKTQKLSFVSILKNKFKSAFFISIFANEKNISLQQYIEGRVGQAPFCAYKGKVFAFNPMLRLETHPGKTGPSSVSCGTQNVDIEHFVRTVARNLNYSGFGSLEYIIDSKTGLLYIIELNPRPTPTCHISDDVVTNDLCEMFFKGLNDQEIILKEFRPYTIAMFPGEKRRDPESVYIKTGYYDIPKNDPELLKLLDK